MSEVALAVQFRAFAESCGRDGAVTYAAICRSAADDAELLALLTSAPLAQRRPNLLLAAVHDLLLGGADHPLATHYDTVATYRGTGPVDPVGQLGPAFRNFCATYRDQVLDRVASGSTQTNEVGRCTALLPALCHIAALERGAPLGLLDLGTSAGLALYFDRYAYTYRRRDGGEPATLSAGDPGSAVTLECSVRGPLDQLPPLTLPALAGRAGLDRSPIDPRDEVGARWLLACLWPDHLPRFTRLQSALRIARSDPDPPARHTGDLVDRLADVAATVAPGHPLVVHHSWVAAYLDPERQRALADAVRALAGPRPVHHLYAESPAETPGLPTPDSPAPGPTSEVATVLVHVPPGGAPVRLADLHPHGRSLRWWAAHPIPARPAAPTGRPGGPGPAPPPR